MKLWQKDTTVHQKIEDFTVGKDRELDLELAKYDIQGSLAHIQMLESIQLLTFDELQALQKVLKKIYQTVEQGQFIIEDGIEDVHSQVELMATRALGDIGKKIHAGRSRNDQVLVDLRLFFRAELQSIVEKAIILFEVLQNLSEQHKEVLMPGYTHLQVAMVSSFGMWFGAYAEALTDDLQLIQGIYKIINQNPLGSAAGYGSSFPLNRKMTTDLLGFDDLCYNSIHAQLGRGKSELNVAFGIAGLAHTISKLAMDVTLFTNQNYGFIAFPDELTTGSSIMPHKKNPDVFELIRGKCNLLMALPQNVMLMTSSLPSGYHRDFQLLKETVFPAIEDLKNVLDIAAFALGQIQINTDILKDKKYKYLYTVEVVNQQVLTGIPFRDAYKAVGQSVQNGTFQFEGIIEHSHEGSLGNLCTAAIRRKLDGILTEFHFKKHIRKIAELVKGE